MLTTTRRQARRAASTSARWPSCSAPMVGTSAMLSPAERQAATAPRSAATVRAIGGVHSAPLMWVPPAFRPARLVDPQLLQRLGRDRLFRLEERFPRVAPEPLHALGGAEDVEGIGAHTALDLRPV